MRLLLSIAVMQNKVGKPHCTQEVMAGLRPAIFILLRIYFSTASSSLYLGDPPGL